MSDPNAAAPPRAEAAVRVGRIELADIDELAAVTKAADVEFHLPRPGRYRGALLDLEAGGVGIQWGEHGAAIVGAGPVWREGAFLACWSGAPSRANGRPLGSGFLYYPPGSEHQSRTEGPMSWVSLRVEALPELAAALAPDLALGPGSPLRYADRPVRVLDEVRRILADARALADAGADGLRDPVAARALREALGAALVRAVAADRPPRGAASLAECSALVRRAAEHARARPHEPVYLSELCAATGASEARLRGAFRRVHGVGPARWLRLRRLHQVRRALRSTSSRQLTVSAAAARFGFYQLGRFAGDYRTFFGELPSQTPRPR